MVIYFSGTGNSRHVAEKIAGLTNDTVISMNKRIRKKDFSPLPVERALVFVLPTYAWRIPRIADDWIRRTGFPGADNVWFVMTCGSEIGDAAKYNRMLCNDKGFSYMGTAQIVMPENYIAMFSAPDREKAKEIIAAAEPDILDAADRISRWMAFPTPRRSLYDRAMSSLVNGPFYAVGVKASPFRIAGGCIGCGRCVKLCPLGNVHMKNGRVTWGGSCTHCMACISHCPTEAIEYGRRSVGKPRYHID